MSEQNGKEKCGDPELQKMILEDEEENYDHLFKETPLNDETTCGFWIFKGSFLQMFANKKAYVFLYGVVGLIFSATYSYFNGTITTIEKRYKIPSRNTGIISVGNDISQLLVSAVLSYYAGRGHRPRWMAVGLFTIVLFCLLNALPHFLYGPGHDALQLTVEYGSSFNNNQTLEILEQDKKKSLCIVNGTSAQCESEEGNFAPQFILFAAQFISGVGGSLYYTLGISYMDDNIKKSKTPALISLSYFLRMLGPAIGYALASFCLKLYVSPSVTPTINNADPRWLGAWWLGWLILGVILLIFGSFLGLFPKALPRAYVRRQIDIEKIKKGKKIDDAVDHPQRSFSDMIITFKRLLRNKVLMLNNAASVFYFFGYMPYWIFTPKYIETQYRQSASTSSLVTGTVALAFSAIGVLLSGVVISKFKPSARQMAAWNIFVGAVSLGGMIAYIFLGCAANDKTIVISPRIDATTNLECNSQCHCDYNRFSPVCGTDGNTYISACHAGCTDQFIYENKTKIYTECSCIDPLSNNNVNIRSNSSFIEEDDTYFSMLGGTASPGSCPVDCFKEFVMFLTVMCVLKFSGATGRATNFLVSVRCVDEKDKPVAMGFGLMVMSLFSFIPSPIFFGMVLDKTCLVWGKTCSGNGNCWLYDGESLRYTLNTIAAIFVLIGTCFDCGVWYYVKHLKIFDDEIEDAKKETELIEKKDLVVIQEKEEKIDKN